MPDLFSEIEADWNQAHKDLWEALTVLGSMTLGTAPDEQAITAQKTKVEELTRTVDRLAHQLDLLRNAAHS